MFFNTIVFRFVLVLASEKDSQIKVFSLFFRKRRFCENHSFPLFFKFRASKNRCRNRIRKKAGKKTFQKIFFAAFWASNTIQNLTIIEKSLVQAQIGKHAQKPQRTRSRPNALDLARQAQEAF